MEVSAQFKNVPFVGGINLKYHSPKYSERGSMLSGHMLSAHVKDGTPIGFIEWGHKLTPNGNSAVMGENMGENHTQESVDRVFDTLWSSASKHAETTGTSGELDRAKGRSNYIPAVTRDAVGRTL
jgi:hypothetical protein